MSIFSILNNHCSFMVYYYLFSAFLHCQGFLSGFLQFSSDFVMVTITQNTTNVLLYKFVHITSQLCHALVVHPLLRKILHPPWLLRSSKNAFIMQSKSTFLEFLRCIHKFGPPKKIFRGEIIQGEWRNFHRARALFLTGVEFHVLPWVWPSLRV